MGGAFSEGRGVGLAQVQGGVADGVSASPAGAGLLSSRARSGWAGTGARAGRAGAATVFGRPAGIRVMGRQGHGGRLVRGQMGHLGVRLLAITRGRVTGGTVMDGAPAKIRPVESGRGIRGRGRAGWHGTVVPATVSGTGPYAGRQALV